MGLAMRVIQRLFQRIAASEDLQVGMFPNPATSCLVTCTGLPSAGVCVRGLQEERSPLPSKCAHRTLFPARHHYLTSHSGSLSTSLELTLLKC